MKTSVRRAAAFSAGLVVPATFERSLMPRTPPQQGLVTGLSALTTYAATAGTLSAFRGRRVAPAIAGLAVGLVTQSMLRQRHGERRSRAAARTAGYQLALGSASGLVVTGLDRILPPGAPRPLRSLAMCAASVGGAALLTRSDRRAGGPDATPVDTLRATASAGVVAGAAVLLAAAEQAAAHAAGRAAASVLPGPAALWSGVGQAAVAGGIGYAGIRAADRAMTVIERGAEREEPGLDTPPTDLYVSGGPDSLVPFSSLSQEGRRHVLTRTRAPLVERVMGSIALAEPVRVFVGLQSAPTLEQRVELALAEMQRLGAFERSLLLLVSPTGSGYVNYAAVEAVEYLSLGDVATVTMQYSLRPSFLSLNEVDVGRTQNRELWRAVATRLAAMPPQERPRVLLFGESLGAHTSQDAFLHEGTEGLVRLGVDSAIWIGTPYASGWKDEVLGGPRADVDPGLVGVFTGIDAYLRLPRADRERLRYVMITHGDDGVAKFGWPLAVQAPPWLQGARPDGVPPRMRWFPFTTFFQVFVDMLNGSTSAPGVFAADGHDYRGDLLDVVHAVYRLRASPEQLARVAEVLPFFDRAFFDFVGGASAASRPPTTEEPPS